MIKEEIAILNYATAQIEFLKAEAQKDLQLYGAWSWNYKHERKKYTEMAERVLHERDK